MGKTKNSNSDDIINPSSKSSNNKSNCPDKEIINSLRSEINSLKKKITRIDNRNRDLNDKNNELEEQIETIVDMIEEQQMYEQDQYYEEEEYEPTYSKRKKTRKDEHSSLSVGDKHILETVKGALAGPSSFITRYLKELSTPDNMFNKTYNICMEYVNLLGEKKCGPLLLKYFIDLPMNQRQIILEKEKEVHKLLNNDNIPFRFKIIVSNLPLHIKNKILEKVDNLQNLEPGTGEYNKLSQWVNGIMEIPWNKYAEIPVNINSNYKDINKFINNSRKCMDDVIYGQTNTKEHITQIIAKMISNPTSIGNVFSVYGPMGTGKTTIIKEGMSKALGIPFSFISLGGTSDSSYLDGHSYTYEGSIPGRIVEAVKSCGCMNPIIYFDELDKISDTSKGREITNLLIHLTDSSQNSNFQDKYYSGIPIDLSRAIFVFSFNHIENVNPILRDRMNLIKVNGFKLDEKFEISKNFLLPKLLQEYNIKKTELIFNDSVIKYVITNTPVPEEGVRNIKRRLETIISKMNVIKLLKGEKATKRKRNSSEKTNNTMIIEGINPDTINFPLELDIDLINKLIPTQKTNFPIQMYT